MLKPRQIVPPLALETLRHGSFDLHSEHAGLSLVVFYRGHHCPICMSYLRELVDLAPEFRALGVRVLAASSDSQERAALTEAKVNGSSLAIGHGLDLKLARAWGLYISQGRGTTSIGVEEPPLFSEPGLFLVSADRSLYYGAVQTMPFARPSFRDLLKALDFTLKTGYPARGEYDGVLP